MFPFDHIESADAGADMDASPVRNVIGDLQARSFHGLVGGGQGQVNEAAHLLEFFFLDEIERIEVFDLSSDLTGELSRIELRNPGYATLSGKQALPNFFRGIAYSTNQPDPSDHDPSSQLLPAFRVLPDVVVRILDGANLFRILVGNFDLESFFEGHY